MEEVVVDEVEEEVDVIGMAEDVGVEVDMTNTADEGEDMVEEAEDIVVVGTVADVTIMAEVVAVAEEDMAVS